MVVITKKCGPLCQRRCPLCEKGGRGGEEREGEGEKEVLMGLDSFLFLVETRILPGGIHVEKNWGFFLSQRNMRGVHTRKKRGVYTSSIFQTKTKNGARKCGWFLPFSSLHFLSGAGIVKVQSRGVHQITTIFGIFFFDLLSFFQK